MYFYLIVAPIAMFIALFIIITFIKYPKILKQPGGDILLLISLSDFTLTAHWFSHGIYQAVYDRAPLSSEPFCLT